MLSRPRKVGLGKAASGGANAASGDAAAASGPATGASVPAQSASGRAKAAKRNGRSAARGAVAVCQVGEHGLSAVWLRPVNGGFRAEARRWSAAPSPQQLRWLAGRATVLLLPKSAYLIRQLQVPAGCEAEAGSVVRLAAEALLPPDFGEAEVSYRRIGRKEGTTTYEVYLIRQSKLSSALAEARRLGVQAHWVLPSAWVHSLVLDRCGGLDVLVDAADQRAEVAIRRGDGGLSVRAVAGGLNGTSQPSDEAHRQLLECIRSLGRRPASAGPIRIGWTGPPHSLGALDGSLEHRKVLAQLWPGAPADQTEPSLTAAACAIASADPRVLAEGSMLPLDVRRRREREGLTGRLKLAAALVGAALVLTYAGLRVSTARYERMLSRLDVQVEQIRGEGEAIGRGRSQLRLLRNLRAGRDDLTAVLQGLREATPEGVTYSGVELDEDGRLRLRGQARSSALPFLLPERLAAQPRFDQITLVDAATVKKAGGSISEFRLEGRLRRAGP